MRYLRNPLVFIAILALLALMGCTSRGNNDPNPQPRPTASNVDFLAILAEYGYTDAELIGSNKRAQTMILGCHVVLRLIDNGPDFAVESTISGPPSGEAVEEALQKLGNSPTSEALHKTLETLTKNGHLSPC